MESRITDKQSIGEKFGDKKKVANSSKFKTVGKVIDTGKTIKDVQVLSDKYVSKRKSELFKRIKASTIVKLLDENNNIESIYNLAEENKEENIQNLLGEKDKSVFKNDDNSVYSYKTGMTDMTQKTTVTAITYATEMLGNLALLSYIILDLRERDEYDSYHIREAVSYPGANISRDKWLTEMIKLRNKDGKLIIIYGNSERHTIPYATLFLNKGFDNIYMLTGGIEEFIKDYPDKCDGYDVQRIINQKLQEEILKKDAMLKKTIKSRIPSSTLTDSHIKNSNDVSINKIGSSKVSVAGSEFSKSTVKNLKKNLQK